MINEPTPEQERGKAFPQAAPVNTLGMPRGDGMFPVAPVSQFQAIYNGVSKLYFAWFDEALQDSYENAYRMTLDPMVSTCMEVRTLASSLLTFSIEPEDTDSEEELSAAKRIQRDITSFYQYFSMRRALTWDAIFTGTSGAQIAYHWQNVKGTLRMRPRIMSPVDGDSIAIDFAGWPSIRVRSGTKPNLINSEWGQAYRLTPEDREGFILAHHNPQAAKYWQGQFARQHLGTGLRRRLYWLWNLKSQLWQMSLDYLAWFARGMTFLFYEHGNDAHRKAIEEAIRRNDGSSAYLYPVFRDAANPRPFEHIPVSSASASFLQQLITSYLDEMIRFVILHQSATTSVGSTGLGSNVAAAHQTTFDAVVKSDALQLDAALSQDLVRVLYRVNEPGIPPGRLVSQVDSPNVEQLMAAAQTIVGLGGAVPEKALRDAAGLPTPKDGETVLGGMQQNQPAGVTEIPDGVPLLQPDNEGQG